MNSIQRFADKKQKGDKISMVTCYDYTFAQLINDGPIDGILVGDSAAMIMHGEQSTVPATMDMMCMHTRAVARGAPKKLIIGDLPFLSYRQSLAMTMENVQRLMQAGAHAIKLEGGEGNDETIQHIVGSGVSVMGHLGLTPQSVHQLGGFKVQGRAKDAAERIFGQAERLQQAGCFALVLECVPASLAKDISRTLTIPTIGIGAGVDTDGQILVLQDLLGLQTQLQPKFVKLYAQGATMVKDALQSYHEEVTQSLYPDQEYSY